MKIVVSLHGLLRYSGRVLGTVGYNRRDLRARGVDVTNVLRRISTEAAPALATCFAEDEEIYVYLPHVTLVVKDRTVVTALSPGMIYEEGYYAREKAKAQSMTSGEKNGVPTAMAAAFAKAQERLR